MSFLTKMFSGGIGKVIEQVGGAVDNIITSPEERLSMKNKFTDIMSTFQLKYQAELTSRHNADMNSDSWWSKNIRPLCLIFLMTVVTVCALTDGNIGGYQIKEAYIKLYEGLLMMAFAFYFGSRGMEKIMATMGKYEMFKPKREKRKKRRDRAEPEPEKPLYPQKAKSPGS